MNKTEIYEVHIQAPQDMVNKELDKFTEKGYYISSIRMKDKFTIVYELTLNAG